MQGTMIDQTTHSADLASTSLLHHWQRELAGLIASGAPRRVQLHLVAGPAVGGGILSCVAATRLLLCTNARAHYRIASEAGVADLGLAAGEALLIAPGASIANVSRESYESAGFIFYPDSIRVYGIHHEPPEGGHVPDPLRLLRHNYVHPVPLGEDGRRLLACALGAAGFGPDSAYRQHLIAALLFQVQSALTQPTACSPGKAVRTFRNLVRHLEAHLAEPLTRAGLARALRLHPNHVSRLFREFASGTFLGFLRAIRLDRAEDYLRTGQLTVAEVASACGFGSSSALIRAFRQRHGTSPGRWAASHLPTTPPVDRTVTTCGLAEKW